MQLPTVATQLKRLFQVGLESDIRRSRLDGAYCIVSVVQHTHNGIIGWGSLVHKEGEG